MEANSKTSSRKGSSAETIQFNPRNDNESLVSRTQSAIRNISVHNDYNAIPRTTQHVYNLLQQYKCYDCQWHYRIHGAVDATTFQASLCRMY